MFNKLEIVSKFAAAFVATGVLAGFSSVAQAIPTTELALVVDASGSINSTEWGFQMTGYHNALDTLLPTDGSVAISIIRFGRTATTVLGMTAINNVADRTTVSDFFLSLSQWGNGSTTCISCGIINAEASFSGSATNSIIDVSTDGGFNVGVDPNGPAGTMGTAEWAVSMAATSLNAIGIGVMPNFAHGPDSFALMATNFSTFSGAIATKIATELQVPEPGTLAIFGLGLAGLGIARRRKVA